MAKEKFNVGNLLPAKPAVIKPAAQETAPLMDRAVETIHPAPAAAPLQAVAATRKISCDLPEDWYKDLKRYCIDHDMKMREYILGLIEADLQRIQPT